MKKAVAALLALTVFLSLFSAFSVFSAAAWDESEIFTSGEIGRASCRERV